MEPQRGSELVTREEKLQLGGVLLPQPDHVVLPPDHLSQDQNDWYSRQTHEQEQGVGPLHDIQPLLVSNHL